MCFFLKSWLALKWIFKPVDPLKIGPITLQGMFLKRQKEVAAEFSSYFARNVLNAQQLWKSVLTDPTTQPAFAALFAEHFQKFVGRITRGLGVGLEPETMELVTNKAISKLPQHVGVTYEYMDKTLGLEQTLRERMEQMTSLQFERVLHPIFEGKNKPVPRKGRPLPPAGFLVAYTLTFCSSIAQRTN